MYSLGSGDLVPYGLLKQGSRPRVGLIQAGINAPIGSDVIRPNTDHLYQAMLAGPWELVIDQRPELEPGNAALDLSKLDDIEIIFDHRAYTMQ